MGIFSSEDRTAHNTYTNQITNYVINEEYITNIYNINNELKQTYNISINTGSTSNDSNDFNIISIAFIMRNISNILYRSVCLYK